MLSDGHRERDMLQARCWFERLLVRVWCCERDANRMVSSIHADGSPAHHNQFVLLTASASASPDLPPRLFPRSSSRYRSKGGVSSTRALYRHPTVRNAVR